MLIFNVAIKICCKTGFYCKYSRHLMVCIQRCCHIHPDHLKFPQIQNSTEVLVLVYVISPSIGLIVLVVKRWLEKLTNACFLKQINSVHFCLLYLFFLKGIDILPAKPLTSRVAVAFWGQTRALVKGQLNHLKQILEKITLYELTLHIVLSASV